MKNIGILTSGGDTPGMNTAIRAVVKAGIRNNLNIFGIFHGYKGLIEGDIRQVTEQDVFNIIHKGGTILKTARSLEFKKPEGFQKALRNIKAFGIEGLIVIGGDGSLRGVGELSENGVKTIGLPGTIDNDLPYTQYTIGFDTAINNVVGEIYKIRDTMMSHDRIGVIEVMGRNCGDIALHAGTACGADAIFLPEVPMDLPYLYDKLVSNRIRGRMTSIVVIAEGAGSGKELADNINQATGLEAKAIVLGYTQRGGNPTAFDRLIATRMGVHAVELLCKGVGNRAVGIMHNEIIDVDIQEALSMPAEFDLELYRIATLIQS